MRRSLLIAIREKGHEDDTANRNDVGNLGFRKRRAATELRPSETSVERPQDPKHRQAPLKAADAETMTLLSVSIALQDGGPYVFRGKSLDK